MNIEADCGIISKGRGKACRGSTHTLGDLVIDLCGFLKGPEAEARRPATGRQIRAWQAVAIEVGAGA